MTGRHEGIEPRLSLLQLKAVHFNSGGEKTMGKQAFRARQAEEKQRTQEEEKKELESQADALLQNKLDRKTGDKPTLQQVVTSIPCWKYGGIFNLHDNQFHYRITIPDLGRVLHCHTRENGKVLTRVHMKPKIRECGFDAGKIKAAAAKGKLTRHTENGLKTVKVENAKGIPSELEQIIRNKLMNGDYASKLATHAASMADSEYTFFAVEKSNKGWGPLSRAIRLNHKKVVEEIIALSTEIQFPCPAF
jgi:hypothetical protein